MKMRSNKIKWKKIYKAIDIQENIPEFQSDRKKKKKKQLVIKELQVPGKPSLVPPVGK